MRQRFSRKAPRQPAKLIEKIINPVTTIPNEMCRRKSNMERNLTKL